MELAAKNRQPGFTKRPLRQDVLYNFFRFRDLSISSKKTSLEVTRITDGTADGLERSGYITPEQNARYKKSVVSRLTPVDILDDIPVEEIYSHVHKIRKEFFGDALDQYLTQLAHNAPDFIPDGINQQAKKAELLAAAHTVIFVLTDVSLWKQFQQDLKNVQGKQILVIRTGLVPQDLQPQAQSGSFDPQKTVLLFYGEEGLTACHGLTVDAIVHSRTEGYHARAITGLWEGQNCLVYVPRGMDMPQHVPLTSKTRLNYSIISRLWQDHGDQVYNLSVPQLYSRYPRYFINVYSGKPSALPLHPHAERLSDFDRQLDDGLRAYVSNFPNAQYLCSYFDRELKPAPICYSAEKQPGILVQAAKVKSAAGAQVLSCEKGITPRQMFQKAQLPGTALVSNFLFFMTPKLGILYNDLRQDRPMEQADAASGHLDYMKTEVQETFPLFRKACIGKKEDGSFVFFNFRLGGGTVRISGEQFRWEAHDVDTGRIYTPYYSFADRDAQRDTYKKSVGENRINVVLLRDKVTCIRRGDVLLPSVGVVLSLDEQEAAPLLKKCKPLENGYYDVSGLSLQVQLDPPADISCEEWAKVRWAYGGGLTLIRNGIGLCDDDHMEAWFDEEGWTSPLSRQTQESNLHSLAKHPRTAIGCTKDGSLIILVYSGRTWRSTGADYKEMIAIARQLFPDVQYLMNCDGGGSAMLGLVAEGEFLELSYPSTSSGSCAGQVRPINTVFYVPVE